jgi:hypothetical protein
LRGVGAATFNTPDAKANPTVQMVLVQASQIWQRVKMISQMTLAGVQNAIGRLSATPGERILLVASNGFLSEQLEGDVNQIIAEALRAQIVIDALDAKGLYVEGPSRAPDVDALSGPPICTDCITPGAPNTSPLATFIFENTTRGAKLQAGDAAMENFAIATGGLLFRNNNDLDFGFYELGVVPAFSYLLTFSAADVRPDGSYHPLTVKVNGSTSSYLEYRPGYYAPSQRTATQAKAPPESKLDRAVSSQENISEIPAVVSSKLTQSASGAQEVSVAIHVDLKPLSFEKKNDRELQRLDFVLALFDTQGNFVTGKRGEMDFALKEESLARLEATGVNATLSLQPPAGSYRLRTVTQEALSGKIAASSQLVALPQR